MSLRILRLHLTSCSASWGWALMPGKERRCVHLWRSFSSYPSRYQSSRRDMQTATAYRPHTLPDNFPPPGNITGLPNTSITADPPSTAEAAAQWSPQQSISAPPSVSKATSNVSVREGEVQKSRPVDPATAASPGSIPSQTATKSRRPKLRPRKAAISLTTAAISQLRTLLSQPEPKMIRVGVKNRGCSGLTYHLEYVEQPGKFDEVVEQDGVKVLIDSRALFSILGSEMDWQEDTLSRRFIFRNPNISKFL